ncbi:MAG: hypothetical protein JXB36_09645, partial [Gammaproteobacteria bacterium]|nr:hypothetical protein [Gammaproteobacteria bacterium]
MRTTSAACFLVSSLAAAPHVQAAWYYEATTTAEGQGAPGGASSVRAWVDGANARIEMTEGGQSGFLEAGTYLLTHDGGDTLYVVDPSDRTISEIDLAQIFQMAGNMAAMTGGMVDMQFKDFTSEQLAQEPGEDVLGYPTTRYRFRTGYTMSIGVLGMTRENRNETEHDVLCTDAIDAAGFGVWLRPDRFRTGNEDMDRMIEQQLDLDCVPLRNRAVTTVVDGRGRESTVTTTTEVTALREEDAPAEAFVLPA